MEVVIRFKDNKVAVRAVGSVLTHEEVKSAKPLIGGLYYYTDVSPALVLAAFEAEGIEFEDFESIEFRPK